MFEAQIAYYLNEYLGKYVEGIDRESLKISIYAGDVVLRNLRLKQDALEELDLPVTVKTGMLGSLTLKVPWNNLGGTPVVVEINDLYLLVRPRDSNAEGERGGQGFDVGSFEERFQEFKVSRVQRRERSWIKSLEKMKMKDSEEKQKGFLRGLIDTVVSNLQISINSIHIRYEDNLTRPGHIFACGFTLEQLCAYTVDDKGTKTFIAPKTMTALRKLLQLKRISIYFDCDTVLWSPVEGWNALGPEGWREWFHPDIIKDDTGRNFVLRPIDGRATYIRRWRDIDQEKDAATELDIQLDSVSVSVSRDQYCNYSLLLSEISLYTARLPYIGFRPQCRPRPGLQAKAWWIYLSYVHRQTAETRKFEWEEVIKSVRLRSKYISLYKVELKMRDLKNRRDVVIPEEVSMLYQRDVLIMKELERELPEPTLVMFRRVAYTEYIDEKDREAEIARSQQQRGWLGWLMGSAQPATGHQPIEAEKSISQDGRITSDEYDTILEVLKTQEESMSLKFETPHTLMSNFTIRLGSVSLNLMASRETSILLGSMNDIAVQMLQYPQTTDLTVKVVGMGIDSSLGAFVETGSAVSGVVAVSNTDALLVKFIRNPQDKRADAILNIELAPSFVYYDPRTVAKVTQFFRPPEEFLMQELADLSVTAASQIEKAKKMAADYAVAAWSEKPKLELRLVLNAPKISLPSKGSDVHLAVDLGLFIIETDPNSDSIKTSQEKGLYECIKVTGTHVSAFLTEGQVDWEASTTSDSPSGHEYLHLLEECSIYMPINIARYSDVEYPMIRMYPKIPSLKFCVSPVRMEKFMKVLQNSIDFGEIQSDSRGSSESSWLDSADWRRECYLLEWGTVKASASWNLYQLVLFRTTLYALKTSSQGDIVSQMSISDNSIVSKVPEEILNTKNMLVIHNCISSDWAEILRSAQAWVLLFKAEKDLQSCIEEVNASIHRMKMNESSQSVTESNGTVETHKSLFYVESHLSEIQLILAGRPSKELQEDAQEDYLLSVSASKGSVNFLYGSEEVNLDLSLFSLEINDMLISQRSGKPMYLARSSDCESETDENLADFSIKVLSPTHPEYKGVKTFLRATFGSLFFYCNRPTVACLMSFGNDLSLSFAGETVPADRSDMKSDFVSLPAPEIVVFCQDQSCVAFAMDFTFKRLQLILRYEHDEQLLAEASIVNFRFCLENISDGTMKIMSSLGNLTVTDLTLDISNPYAKICGLRDTSTSSLVSIEFDMYPAHVANSLRVPANMLCYRLSAHLSKLRIVFLYRFVQEILNYISVLMEMKPEVELLDAEAAGASNEQQLASKDAQPFIMQMDLSMDAPLIMIPRSSISDDGLKLDLGTLSLSNRVYKKSISELNIFLIDASVLHLSGIQLSPCSIANGDSSSLVDLSDHGWKVFWRRPLQDVSNTDIPTFEVEVEVDTLNASMSDKEYEAITSVVSTNVSESPHIPVRKEIYGSNAKSSMSPRASGIQVENSQQLNVAGSGINVRVYINLKHLQLNLWKDIAESKSDLSFLQMNNVYFSYTSHLSGKAVVDLCIPKLEISDMRRNVPVENSLVISSGKRASFLMLKYSTDMNERSLSLILQKPLIVLEIGFLLDLTGFFVPVFAYSKTEPLPFRSSDIILKEGHLVSLAYDLYLSPATRLLADTQPGQYTVDGCGHSIFFPRIDDLSEKLPLLMVGNGCTLRIMNAKVVNAESLGTSVKLGPGAELHLSREDGVELIYEGNKEDVLVSSNQHQENEEDFRRLSVSFEASNMGLYLVNSKPSFDQNTPGKRSDTKMISIKMDLMASYINEMTKQNISASIVGLRASQRSIIAMKEQLEHRSRQDLRTHQKLKGKKESEILLPMNINAQYVMTEADVDINLTATDAHVKLSPGTLELITTLSEEVLAPVKQPGPNEPAYSVARYKMIGSIRTTEQFAYQPIEADGCSLQQKTTFWQPATPTGYVAAGAVVTNDDKAPTFEVISLARNSGLIVHPEFFNKVFSGENIFLWQPVAPSGYHPLGLYATKDDLQPKCEDACCVAGEALVQVPIGECVVFSQENSSLFCNVDNSLGTFITVDNSSHGMYPMDLRYPIGVSTYGLSSTNISYSNRDKNISLEDVLASSRALQSCYVGSERVRRASHSRSIMSPKTMDFKRIWTDNGTLSDSKVVSIWRPIAPAGYSILGDCFVIGTEPPKYVHVLRTDGAISGKDSKFNAALPAKFQLLWHDGNPKIDHRLSIWRPVPPDGFVSMGNVAHIGMSAPDLDIRCISQELALPASSPRKPLWLITKDDRSLNPLSVWHVDYLSQCFHIDPTDSITPPQHMFTLNIHALEGSIHSDSGKTINAVMKVSCLDFMFVDSFGIPTLQAGLQNIESGIRGYSKQIVQSYGGFKPCLKVYNCQFKAWEPILEEFDAIIKIDINFTKQSSSGIDPGIHITFKSSTDMMLTTLALSHVNAIISSYKQCMAAMHRRLCEDSNLLPPAIGQTSTSIVKNMLGVSLDLEIEGHENIESYRVPAGEEMTVSGPVPDQLNFDSQIATPVTQPAMILLDIESVCCDLDSDRRILVACRLGESHKAFYPRTRALLVDEGVVSFEERLVISCYSKDEKSLKCIVEIWDVEGDHGAGFLLGFGVICCSLGSPVSQEVQVNGENGFHASATCKFHWQNKTKHIERQKLDSKHVHVGQRAVAIGGGNDWHILPDVYLQMADNQSISTLTGIQDSKFAFILERIVENHVWQETFRSNCQVLNKTGLLLAVGLSTQNSGSPEKFGVLAPDDKIPLPVKWGSSSNMLCIAPIEQEQSENDMKYGWSIDKDSQVGGLVLAEIAERSSCLLECSPNNQQDSLPILLCAHISCRFVRGSDIIDWVITITPALVIRNHVPLKMNLFVDDRSESSLDTSFRSTVFSGMINPGMNIPIYEIPKEGELGFKMDSEDYLWAEKGHVHLLSQDAKLLRDSVRICRPGHRIPSEIVVSRSHMHDRREPGPAASLPCIVTLSSPLWIINKTALTIESIIVSVQNTNEKRNNILERQLKVNDSDYDWVLMTDAADQTDAAVLCARQVAPQTMDLSNLPFNTPSGDSSSTYGIKIRVRGCGWTEPLLFDSDFAGKYGFVQLSARPLLLKASSQTKDSVFSIVLRMEISEFNDSRILYLEPQVLVQNKSRVALQGFQCAPNEQGKMTSRNGIVLPHGASQMSIANDSPNSCQSITKTSSVLPGGSFVRLLNQSPLDDEAPQSAVFDIPADCICRPLNGVLGTRSHYLCLRKSNYATEEYHNIWSRPIQLDDGEERLDFVVTPCVSHDTINDTIIVRLRLSSRGPGLKLVIIETAECLAPYVLENKTPNSLCYQQSGWEEATQFDLKAFSAVGIAPEFSCSSEGIEVDIFSPNFKSYSKRILLNGDTEEEPEELSISSSRSCTLRATFDLTTTVSIYGSNSIPGGTSGYSIGRGGIDKTVEITSGTWDVFVSSSNSSLANPKEVFLKLEIPGISLSIIDSQPQEIMLLTIEDIILDLSRVIMPNGVGTYFGVIAKTVQIDNQLPGTLLPVAFTSVLGTKSSLPMVSFRYSAFSAHSRGGIQIPFAGLRLPNKIQLAIEESLIWRMNSFFEYLSTAFRSDPTTEVTAAVDAMTKLRLLSVAAIPLSVSFQNNPRGRPSSIEDSSIAILMDLAAFKGVDVKMKGFELENISSKKSSINARILEIVKSELTTAAFSLVRTFGIVGGATRLLGFLGAKMAKYADASTKSTTSMQHDIRDSVESATEADASSFGSSALKGFRGRANKPIEGARAEGFEGAFKGVAKGVAGVFTATANKHVEVYDASFAKGRQYILVLQRKRLPRVLGWHGRITETYRHGSDRESILESLGQSYLWSTWLSSHLTDNSRLENYEEHFVLPKNFVLLFTNVSILLTHSPTFVEMDGAAEIGSLPAIEVPGGEIKWRILLEDILAFELRWSDPDSQPERLIIHRKDIQQPSTILSPLMKRHMSSLSLALEIQCFDRTPQASQIKFVASKIVSKYYQDPKRQDLRWAARHAARLALPPDRPPKEFPMQMPCVNFEMSWHTNPNRSPLVYFWRPVAPPGYKPIGSVATLGSMPPIMPVPCFRDDVTLLGSINQASRGSEKKGDLPTAFPEEYTLIWRFNGTRPVTMWMPVPPKGYVAMGAIVLDSATIPSLDDYLCIREDLVKESQVFDSPIWSYDPEAIRAELQASQATQKSIRKSMQNLQLGESSPTLSYLPENWKVSVWQVDSPLMTVLVVRGLKKPPRRISCTI